MAIKFEKDVAIIAPSDPTLEEPRSIDGMADDLREAIQKGTRKILVDLDKTTILNSDAIRAIVKAHEEAKKSGQAVYVSGLKKVDRPHAVFNLIEFVQHFDSREAALRELSGQSL